MKNNYLDWVNYLRLTEHPEGGYFREIYRNANEISDAELTCKYSGKRNLSTSIYYMLRSGQVSKLHRLKSDELWYFHYGSPLRVHVFNNNNKEYTCFELGTDFKTEQQLQLIIPAGVVFGAEVINSDSFSIVGCMVSPGFHFEDFELMSYQEMIQTYPGKQSLIVRFT